MNTCGSNDEWPGPHMTAAGRDMRTHRQADRSIDRSRSHCARKWAEGRGGEGMSLGSAGVAIGKTMAAGAPHLSKEANTEHEGSRRKNKTHNKQNKTPRRKNKKNQKRRAASGGQRSAVGLYILAESWPWRLAPGLGPHESLQQQQQQPPFRRFGPSVDCLRKTSHTADGSTTHGESARALRLRAIERSRHRLDRTRTGSVCDEDDRAASGAQRSVLGLWIGMILISRPRAWRLCSERDAVIADQRDHMRNGGIVQASLKVSNFTHIHKNDIRGQIGAACQISARP
jgi:hypothetical protein